MNHQQLLTHLNIRHAAHAIASDTARLLWDTMTYTKEALSATQIQENVIAPLLLRWSCALPPHLDHPYYSHTITIALATILHKFGITIPSLTQQALEGIEILEQQVVLSDGFSRRQASARALLLSPTKPLSKRPAVPDSITFYRPGDVIAVQIGETFHALYVTDIHAVCEGTEVEVYAPVYSHRPTIEEIIHQPLREGTRNFYIVFGTSYTKDPANQWHLVASGMTTPPQRIAPPKHGPSVSDIFRLQHDLASYTATPTRP